MSQNQNLFVERALLPDGWARQVRIGIEEGCISTIQTGCAPEADDVRVQVAIPGIPNLHSHAFQRGMAGLAEVRGHSEDTFWTWREIMYRFALAMSPEQIEAIASQAYIEMLESGFTRVGEFHYLHHDDKGSPYSDIAEMAGRIAASAEAAGINLTLLPVFYAHSTFGGAAPTSGQRRFINDLDSYEQLVSRCGEIVAGQRNAVLGMAPHSLRAVAPDELTALVQTHPRGPVHMHIAEQAREVQDCLEWSGQRPVEWLLERLEIDSRWCLIHATHMDNRETRRLAASGAVAGLCPITEANLGDGIFPGSEFVASGGRYGIGTDSNVLIGASAELRQLEYAQRLGQRQRNVLAGGPGSTGRALFDAAVSGGNQALGLPSRGIEVGSSADIVSLIADHPETGGDDSILDALIFSGSARVNDVWVGGRLVVSGGVHINRPAVSREFRRVIRELTASL